MIEGYRISSTYEDMDLDAVHAFITHSYWAKGIPKETLSRAMRSSLCFGVFDSTGHQVGFARAITDSATYSYLADVYILKENRGQGLSKWLMSEVVAHPELQGLRRITLATLDAHGLYTRSAKVNPRGNDS